MRLELGSGGRPQPGFTTLDIRPDVGADIVDDATTLFKILNGTCDTIRAAHVLEHFPWRDTGKILTLWRSKLIAGGTLEIEVPNLTGHVMAWRASLCDDARFVEALYGEQDYPENTHRTAFTVDTLHSALDRAGFTAVRVADVGLALVATARR